VATEVSKSAVAAARRNFEANGVTNGFVARMSSEEFVEAWHSGRQYTRLSGIDLAACDFKTIFVDPPRAGLDEATLKLLREFERVVYVSCNPETLHRDVSAVADRFEIAGMAMFDQFPYTHHVECGVYLVKKGGEEESEEGKRVAKRKADEAAGLV
jgi:tRNA (uracil-5-)-methyltransferase